MENTSTSTNPQVPPAAPATSMSNLPPTFGSNAGFTRQMFAKAEPAQNSTSSLPPMPVAQNTVSPSTPPNASPVPPTTTKAWEPTPTKPLTPPSSSVPPTPPPVVPTFSSPPPPAPKSGNSPVPMIFALIALLAIGFSVWSYFPQQQLQTRLSQLEQASIQTSEDQKLVPPTDMTYEENLMATDSSTASNSAAMFPVITKAPADWREHFFPSLGIRMFTPKNWNSDARYFSGTDSTLLRFWQGTSAETATIQLDITKDWQNGDVKNLPRLFGISSDTIRAAQVDPPAQDQQKLDRYQSNYYFEHEGKVYTLNCTHNWITEEYQTCQTMLKTMQFEAPKKQ